ncbi:aminoacyl-tRNA hydrolase [Helicobacter sp. 11S02596-1]|uniref:aminoacyl-tRNA hydrolase n=1 Tax=Helicobacter sp. 11S02596-1 TaxID=1476194 RepID=UPI000BA7B32B|nr:aminoacyl-tRNA hydrolase [Helicobacter sp. 11S02596-1]PAF45108.1 aminoacyl-tRNA hydrolase [Helicobacter sp. 11S02596-1]
MASLLIAGLGNPGAKYQHTRHNIGFDILDSLASNLGICFDFSVKFNAQIAKFPSKNVFLCKPQTFMNLSGESIASLMGFYKIEMLFVAHDDLDLPLGCVRFKKGGSSGGHNGLKSIDSLYGSDYYRLRFGIGRDEKIPVVDYVLQAFAPAESEVKSHTLKHATEALEFFIQNNDFSSLQGRFSKNIKPENTQPKNIDSEASQ